MDRKSGHAHAAKIQAKDPDGTESEGSSVQSHTQNAKQNLAIHACRPITLLLFANPCSNQSAKTWNVSDIFLKGTASNPLLALIGYSFATRTHFPCQQGMSDVPTTS